MGHAEPMAAALLGQDGLESGCGGDYAKSLLLLLQSGADTTLALAVHHQNTAVTPEPVLTSLRPDFRFSLSAESTPALSNAMGCVLIILKKNGKYVSGSLFLCF